MADQGVADIPHTYGTEAAGCGRKGGRGLADNSERIRRFGPGTPGGCRATNGYHLTMHRIFLLAIGLVVGCSDSGATKVAVEYQRHRMRAEDAKAYELMTAADLPLAEFVRDPSDSVFEKLFLDRISVEATSTLSTGGFLAVNVKTAGPDPYALLRATDAEGFKTLVDAGIAPALKRALLRSSAARSRSRRGREES